VVDRGWRRGTAAYLALVAVVCTLTIASGEALFGILPIMLTAPASLVVVTVFDLWIWPDVWDAPFKSVMLAALGALLNVAGAYLLSRVGRGTSGGPPP
jgi:hypothetical protein